MEISRGQARRRPRLKTTTRMHPESVPEPPVYTRITHPYIPCGMALVAQRPPLGVATACRHNLKTPSRCRIFHRFFLLPCAPRFPARFFASPRLCAFALNPRLTSQKCHPPGTLWPPEYATDCDRISPPLAPIPKGLRHLAQGCEARATLGNRAKIISNPNRGCALSPAHYRALL